MANKYGVPDWLEKKVRERDTTCVYCHVKLKSYPHAKGTPSDKATLEHIDNDRPPSAGNIAVCCASCNSSKGAKTLLGWFATSYCKKKNIRKETVDGIIQGYIERNK